MKWTAQFIVITGIYKSVVASNRRTTCPREGACRSIHAMNLQYMAVIKDSQIFSHSVRNLFTDHMELYYTKGRCHPLSSIGHITRRMKKGKGLELEVPCKYNYYCGPTKDPELI